MTRGDVDDDPFLASGLDIFKDFGQFPVVRAYFVPRIDVLDEVKEGIFAQFLRDLRLILLQEVSDTPFILL